MNRERGFTLLELVVTVVVLLVLLAGAALLLRPVDYSAQERQAKRYLDAALMMQALTRYAHDNGGLPTDLPTEPTAIGDAVSAYDLCAILVPAYLRDIPLDPVTGIKSSESEETTKRPCVDRDVSYLSGYSIMYGKNGVEISVLSEDELLQLSQDALGEAGL